MLAHIDGRWEATGGHGRPREATGGHGRPREATGGHGRPRSCKLISAVANQLQTPVANCCYERFSFAKQRKAWSIAQQLETSNGGFSLKVRYSIFYARRMQPRCSLMHIFGVRNCVPNWFPTGSQLVPNCGPPGGSSRGGSSREASSRGGSSLFSLVLANIDARILFFHWSLPILMPAFCIFHWSLLILPSAFAFVNGPCQY